MVDYKSLLEDLREDEREMLARHEEELRQLRTVIAYAQKRGGLAVRKPAPPPPPPPPAEPSFGFAERRQSLKGMSIGSAAEVLLREGGNKPLKAAQIAKRLVSRGLETSSANFSTAVYNTLKRKSDLFYTEDGLWSLIDFDEE